MVPSPPAVDFMAVSGALRKPKTQAYRSFLYLNGDEVIHSLSALQGGEIDEILTRTAEEGGGELGAELNVGAAKGKGGRKRSRRSEEEIRRKRTEHSATALLLRKLHEEEAIGVIEGAYGPEVYAELDEHMLLEFQADIRIHPLHQVVSAGRAWLQVAKEYGVSQAEIRGMRETVQLLELMSQPGQGERRFLAFAETSGTKEGHKLVVPIREEYLLVPLDEFVGRATFIAQVDRMIPEGEEVLAIRLIRNAPQLSIERQGLEEALPDFIEGFSELGIDVSEDDFFLKPPTVVLKPICIFK